MYRRSGAPRASVRGQRKINQQQPQAQGKKATRAVIGVSSVPLSSRFTNLADETTPRQAQKQHKVAVVKMPQKKGKAQPVLRVAGGKKKGMTPPPTKKQIQQQQQKQKLQQVAQNNRNKRQQVAKPPTGEDLDMEMDEYWHDAGKGPDPKAVQLDRQMEDYWAAKPTQDNTATKTEAEPAPDATMES
ncbi:hypothetical protein PC110_g1908 [Phytophthora cactorum]|uniref:Chromatin target of PRMT1 protein C-terminal domain-containing protein n=1 Tax=Phytophthora cactorum TaxID=29920 RepID=A0A329SZE0_9STRA|nr:hypothetical protein PC110_g1908 [Phytophthora cactorum]